MAKFDWDDANRLHIARHNIAMHEAEEVLLNDPLDLGIQDAEGELRLMEVGETSQGRILVVVSTMRGEKIRVVTAFDAAKKWRTYYLARRTSPYGTKTDRT